MEYPGALVGQVGPAAEGREDFCRRRPRPTKKSQSDLVAVKPLLNDHLYFQCFNGLGRVLAEVGPRTRLNGSGSKNGAEHT